MILIEKSEELCAMVLLLGFPYLLLCGGITVRIVKLPTGSMLQ